MNNNSVFKYAHLTLSDRIAIEQGLRDRLSFNAISKEIDKDATTISKEIRRYIKHSEYLSMEADCIFFKKCRKTDLCNDLCFNNCRMCTTVDCTKICSKWKPAICDKLRKPPYVCNACSSKQNCNKSKLFYRARAAHKEYEKRLSESRQGINLSIDEIHALNELLEPLIKSGQPISHIYATNADKIGISRKTLYNYDDAGLFTFRNMDLQRKVKYKKRKKNGKPHSADYACRRNRTYRDFEKFIEKNSEA